MKTILTTLFFALTSSAGTAFAGVNDEVRATFDRFVAAQNAHDVSAVRDLLVDNSRCADMGAGRGVDAVRSAVSGDMEAFP